MLWFNFILDLNFIFLCFKHIVKHNHTHRTKENKRIKLNHKIYLSALSESFFFFHDPLFSLQCSIMNMCSLKIPAQLVGHHGTKINHTTL